MDNELALAILKQCFHRADHIRIVQDQVEDGQRHTTSDVTRFVVEYEKDHKIQRSHVAIKAPKRDILEMCEKLNIYSKEISMYETVRVTTDQSVLGQESGSSTFVLDGF